MEEKIIEEIKKCPWMYEKSNSDYKNVKKKDKFWKNLSIELGFDEKILKTRWKTLRNKFRIELKNMAQPSGSGAVKERKWKYFEMMQFLKDGMSAAKTVTNYELESQDIIPLPEVIGEENAWDSFAEGLTTATNSTATGGEELHTETTKDSSRSSKGHSKQDSLQKAGQAYEKLLRKAVKDLEGEAPSPIETFFLTMSRKVVKANLTENQEEDLMEAILLLVNRKLQAYKSEGSNNDNVGVNVI